MRDLRALGGCVVLVVGVASCVRALPRGGALEAGRHYRARVRCTGAHLCEASCRTLDGRFEVVLIRPSVPLPSTRDTIVDFVVDDASTLVAPPGLNASYDEVSLYACTPLVTRSAGKDTPACHDGP